ncbi:hypothetical protein MKC70_14055 [[Clostridium] innocuum]|nr:hypothetical protein [Erysipelotrichaceae bacterium]MCR0383601.1 hypothetical protein [[Clostridium] innocuum]MCR0413129.1 hypothetical protein [[Clostridium] innocuum]MCR0534240.1 hypothetical protein [[Clostridium] innocuum]MDU1118861.1 hypothetical protein [Erysipelotrichaceae bacterium]
MRLPQGAAQYGFGFWIAAQLPKAIDGIMAHSMEYVVCIWKKAFAYAEDKKKHMRKEVLSYFRVAV